MPIWNKIDWIPFEYYQRLSIVGKPWSMDALDIVLVMVCLLDSNAWSDYLTQRFLCKAEKHASRLKHLYTIDWASKYDSAKHLVFV